MKDATDSGCWDHTSHSEFVAYYADKSIHPKQLEHFRALRNAILRVLQRKNGTGKKYDVVDIGCNAGGQCSVWAESGHHVRGLDVNAPLIELARERAAESGQQIDYRIGSATDLPWADSSMDVCIATELLEHVRDWERCVDEFVRILRPGGALLVTTTNKMCPRQCEFNLPFYSWYPTKLKQHYERLAVSTRPELANNAKYPAVHWFSPYGLANEFRQKGLEPLDRFDIADTSRKTNLEKLAFRSIRTFSVLRFLAHGCFAGTTVLGIKR